MQWWFQGFWRRIGVLAVILGLAISLITLAAPRGRAADLEDVGDSGQNRAVLGLRTSERVRITWLPLVPRRTQSPLNDRLGVGVVGAVNPGIYPEFASLRIGWYQSWAVRTNPERPHGSEFVQTVRIHQKLTCPLGSPLAHDRAQCPYVLPYDYVFSPSAAVISEAARAIPGAVWLIGNEMDRRDWPGGGQDEMVPQLYARAYHDLYTLIKAADPTARVAIGGVIQATPLRLQYLTIAWDTYRSLYNAKMPVDVWNVHNFILKERLGEHGASIPPGFDVLSGVDYPDRLHVDMGLFNIQIRAFRQWMKDRGEQNKPLHVSEYGVLYGHEGLDDPQIVQDFMLSTFDYFLYTRDCSLGYEADDCRLVQRWAWYSLDDDGSYFGFNPNTALFDPDTRQLTDLGAKFRQWSLSHMSVTGE